MEGPESFFNCQTEETLLLLHNTAVLMYPAHSGFSHSLTHSLSISHQHEQKEEAFARGEIVGGEDP